MNFSNTFQLNPKLYLPFISSVLSSITIYAAENTNLHQLTTLEVQADSAEQSSEQSQSYTQSRSRSATKLNLDLRETPQTINIVTRQQLDDFKLNEIREALSNTPGLYVSRQETDRTTYNARGFNISNMQIDGFNLPLMAADYFIGSTDMSIYDRIEVSKGANALTSAVGTPSATLNFIRKRPSKDLQIKSAISYGSWDNQRYEFDISGKIINDGRIRGRLIATEDNGNSYLDHYSHETNVVSGILEADLTDQTLLTVGHTQLKHKPNSNNWGALPMLNQNGNMLSYSRSYNPMPDWVYWDSKVNNSFIELSHQINGRWKINAHYSHNKLQDEGNLLYFTGTPTASGSGVKNYPSYYQETMKTSNADINITGSFPLWGQNHELAFGYTWNEINTHQLSHYITGTTSAIDNWWNYTSKSYATVPSYATTSFANYTLEQKSAYLATRLHFNDAFKILLGINHTQATAEGVSYGAPVNYDSSKTSPYAGITLDLDPNYTWYASYAKVFLPTHRFSVNTTLLAPTTGTSWETGIKADWLDGSLTGSISYFNNRFNGFPVRTSQLASNGQRAYAPQDIESNGIEVNLVGKLTDRINTSFGYMRLFNMLDNDTKAEVRTFTPRDTINLLTTYQPKSLEKLKLGLGLQYIGATRYSITSNLRQDAYALINAMASYQINSNFSVQLNGYNLTNKKYLNSLENAQAFYGAPANYTVTFKFNY